MPAGYFPKFRAILLYFRENEKNKYIIKSKQLLFCYWVFGLYYRQMPGGYIVGYLSNIKAVDNCQIFFQLWAVSTMA
jgi:hypothetical protein